MSLSINGREVHSIHFTGILGSGMSALAQFLRWLNVEVSGSDRSLNSTATEETRRKLAGIKCALFPQDGSGISADTGMLCVSTAIEDDNPDIAAAQRCDVPVIHRSDVLAALVKSHRTIAVAGTSGKSTVTSMIFEFLTTCGKAPSLISGAPLRRLKRQDLIGNAFRGTSDILVVEADESDGTLVKYEPFLSLFLNVSKDHKTTEEVIALFSRLAKRSRVTLVNADDPLLSGLEAAHTFSLSSPSEWRPEYAETGKEGSTLRREGREFHLPLIGEHNISNCSAALAACELFGCDPEQLRKATAAFEGVARRFTISKTGNGIWVVDDFAHNPEKIRAAVTAARTLSSRITALYQPHGFGPTRFLREEYRTLFSTIFGKNDTLYLLPIYYAGGTAQKDISSGDLKNDLQGVCFTVDAPGHRDDLLPVLRSSLLPGDCILVMGARDPSLSEFVRNIVRLF